MRRFQNQTPIGHEGFGDVVRWMATRKPGPWRKWTDVRPAPAPPFRVGRGEMRVTFVNHSTVLVQMDGVNVLTDPIWSERCSPVSFAGPKRVHAPGLRFEDLPPIDVVVVSHNHYDHMDLPTLRRLAVERQPRIFVPLGNRVTLERRGVRGVEELDWWQSERVREGVHVHAVPAQHFSARGLFDRDRALWAGFVVTGPASAMYFAGDTGFGPHFGEIRERYGPPRLALLPIGAYRPEWFMSRVHTSPDEALSAHEILDAGTSVGIHFGTFRLADDGQDEPAERIEELLRVIEQPPPRFWVLGPGESRDVPAVEAAERIAR
ncbi:MAG TPA: MBL fold metallo-hydrolase [Thermoanaerobaculia bacterium]|jgi:L-ascorbate metabolism protein UlaG (beta-lactamase superfamily)|nr:MBL fold metallo-hydrolase [Thermoanaerobaculia bacterium]